MRHFLRRYGYRRIHIKQRREGWAVNRKLTYRLYREAGLAVRRRKRKRIGPFERKPLPKPLVANDSWSMDFMSDGLADGRRLRCLTIVDDCTRECVAIRRRDDALGRTRHHDTRTGSSHYVCAFETLPPYFRLTCQCATMSRPSRRSYAGRLRAPLRPSDPRTSILHRGSRQTCSRSVRR